MNFKYNYSLVLFLLAMLFTLLWVGIPYLFSPDSESDKSEINDSFYTSPHNPLPHISEEIAGFDLEELVRPFDSLGPINSILISQHGELLSEEYFKGMNARRAHNIKSASKSILSILIGIAIEEGYLEGVDQKIGDFFPEYLDEQADSAKASITIDDLLTMRSGLASTSRGHYGRWVTSNNWIRYALNRPLTGTPGVDRIYSTGNTHLLSVILTRASGMSTLAFANRYLFHPMDIQVAGWDRDPQGYFLGGNNMALIPQDIDKIGQLMLNMGVYNGERLVSGDWIIRSVKPVTGRGESNNYGYLWFRRMSGDFHKVYAFGNGGQYLMILPELDAVITVTTRNSNSESTRGYRSQLFSALDRDIIPWLAANYTPEKVL